METLQPRDRLLAAHDEVPLCLGCLEPVAPVESVCVNCGEAVGQLTPYLPWEHIRWEARIWGRMWDQVWERRQSLPGRALRVALIAAFFPWLLLFALPKLVRVGDTPPA